ncbi:hypothetical protein CR513_36805, partial [Mucuna pruriens]
MESNNQAKYEALLARIRLAKKLRVAKLTIKSNSQLVTGKVNDEYQARDLQLIQYLGELEAERAIKEVHEGACGSHIGGRALASKIARTGFY